MEQVLLPNLDILHIKTKNRILYGVSQQNYPTYWKRLSGCGPTTASNLFIYLSQTHESMESLFPERLVTFRSALSVMGTMWNFITPTIRGVNKVSAFADGAENYLKQLGSPIYPVTFEVDIKEPHEKNIKRVQNFLLSSLKKNFPVAFLNLHSGKLRNLDSWHWVMIAGVEFDKENLFAIIYDEGEKKRIDLVNWLKTTRKNGSGFVSFRCKY